MTTTAETPQGSAVARAPRVFLSHATADHEFVESVRETLEAARPWGQTDLEFILLPVSLGSDRFRIYYWRQIAAPDDAELHFRVSLGSVSLGSDRFRIYSPPRPWGPRPWGQTDLEFITGDR